MLLNKRERKKAKMWPAQYSSVDISVMQKLFCTTFFWVKILRKSRMTRWVMTSVITHILPPHQRHSESECPSYDRCTHFWNRFVLSAELLATQLQILTHQDEERNPWISHERETDTQTAASMGANKREEKREGEREKREEGNAWILWEKERVGKRMKERRDGQREADKTRSSHMTGIDCRQD